MNKIHKFDFSDIEARLIRNYNRIPILLERINSGEYGFEFIFDRNINSLGMGNALHIPKIEKINYFNLALEAITCIFKMALNEGKTIPITIGKIEREFEAKILKSEVDIAEWTKGFFLSVIKRNSKSLVIFQQIDQNIFKHAEGESPEFLLKTPYFFKDIVQSKDTYQHKFDELKQLSNPDMYQIFNIPLLHKIDIPLWNVWYSLAKENEKEFNQNLEKALCLHQEYWSNTEEYNHNNPEGYLSLGLTAACALAYDKGMNVTVESEYIPRWMIEADF